MHSLASCEDPSPKISPLVLSTDSSFSFQLRGHSRVIGVSAVPPNLYFTPVYAVYGISSLNRHLHILIFSVTILSHNYRDVHLRPATTLG